MLSEYLHWTSECGLQLTIAHPVTMSSAEPATLGIASPTAMVVESSSTTQWVGVKYSNGA